MEKEKLPRRMLKYINNGHSENKKSSIGQTFGKLTVIEEKINYNKNGNSFRECICKCQCGNVKIAPLTRLRSHGVRSCGCIGTSITHGFARKSSVKFKKTYVIWVSMRQRCFNKNSPDYENYGGRGISVCDSWLKFENFVMDMGVKPDGLSIDRIDNNKGYCKENCRWTTTTVQSMNRRPENKTSSKYKGVYYRKEGIKHWRCQIGYNGKKISLGSFSTEEEAAKRYNEECLKIYGCYAYLNEVK